MGAGVWTEKGREGRKKDRNQAIECRAKTDLV